jgi:hypothetical protein
MKAYHKACNSNRLNKSFLIAGKRILSVTRCLNCGRLVEDWEIARPSFRFDACVSKLMSGKKVFDLQKIL